MLGLQAVLSPQDCQYIQQQGECTLVAGDSTSVQQSRCVHWRLVVHYLLSGLHVWISCHAISTF